MLSKKPVEADRQGFLQNVGLPPKYKALFYALRNSNAVLLGHNL
jgi:hypothetical protein